MEVSLIKESTDGSTKDAETVSKSSHCQQIVLPNNHEQGTHNCGHFSIRGYVAEVRKREIKLCCPLFKSPNRTPDEHPNLVLPLVVKKFRQWNCQNCLHEITVTEAAIGNGTSMNIENDQVIEYRSLTGNTMVASQPSAKSIVSLPHEPEENFLERRVTEKDSSICGSIGKCRPLISGGPQVHELQSFDLIKEGISVPRSDQDKDHEDKGCSSQPLIVATEGEASQGGNIVVRSKTSEAAINDQHMIGIISSKRKDTELVHGVGDAGISKKMTASMSFNVAVSDQRDDQGLSKTVKTKDSSKIVVKGLRMPRKDVAIRSSHDNFNCFDRGRHKERDTNMGFTDTMAHTQDEIVYPAGPGDRMQNKRPPKMRLIDDIMKSEDLRKAENIGKPNGGARINGKGNPEKVSIIRDGVGGNYNVKSDASNIEDKNLGHRSELVTETAEPKPNRKRKFASNSDGACIGQWHNKYPRKPKSHKQETKGKYSHTELGKFDRAAMVDIDLNLGYYEVEDEREISGKKTSFSKKKNKRPLIEDGASFQILKNHVTQLPRKREEKQINLWTPEQQEEDDIPRDIVELLAKIRKQKLLMDDTADNGSTHNLSMVTGSMEDDNRCNMADRERHNLPMMTVCTRNGNIGAYGETVSGKMHCSTSSGEPLSNFPECGYLAPVGNDRKDECEPKNYDSSSKKILGFDLNQAVTTSASMDSLAFSPSIDPSLKGGQLAVSRNFLPKDAYWNSMETLPLRSYHVNHITPHITSSSGHDGSSVLLNGSGFGNFNPTFSSNDLDRRGTLQAVEDFSGYQKSKGESSINEGRTFLTKHLAVAKENGHNPEKVYPMDIDTNESMTATFLLRLMDQNAGSGESCYSSIHEVSVGTEVGIRCAEGTKLPRIFESSDQVQQAKNPTILFRPIARVGGVGPLLQRVIASSSNNSMSSFGFPVKTNAVGKGDALQFTATSRDMISKGTDYSIGALSHPGYSVTRNGIVQDVTDNKNNAFQPVRGTPKMENCVLNRNPADFAMIDEDSEYMIGYKKRRPRSRKVQSPSNPKGRKRQKVMRVNNLGGSNRS